MEIRRVESEVGGVCDGIGGGTNLKSNFGPVPTPALLAADRLVEDSVVLPRPVFVDSIDELTPFWVKKYMIAKVKSKTVAIVNMILGVF